MSLDVLRAADFNWTRALHDIWVDPPFHIEDLNKPVSEAIFEEFQRGLADPTWRPIGQIVIGNAGSGKTHLMSALRQRVWAANGWFVLIDITGMSDFWRTAALSFVNSLSQRMPSGQQQRKAILNAVLKVISSERRSESRGCQDAVVPDAKPAAAAPGPLQQATATGRRVWVSLVGTLQKFMFGEPESPGVKPKLVRVALSQAEAIDHYLAQLRRFDPANAQRFQDVVRALLFLDSDEFEVSDFAFMWLQGENLDDAMRRRLKFSTTSAKPEDIARGLFWLMGIAGPTMIAIDQIDAVVSSANIAHIEALSGLAQFSRASPLVHELAKGLIELHDLKGRALTVVSCLEATWDIVENEAIDTVRYRFVRQPVLKTVLSASIAERLIGDRMQPAFRAARFPPPYTTWPFLPQAVESAVGMRPRMILIRCDEHRRACLANREIAECQSLAEAQPRAAPEPGPRGLDARFEEEIQGANPALFGADEATDAARLAHLCELYLGHLDLPDTIDAEVKPDTNRRTSALHASLTFIFRDQRDRQERWCFRWLAQDHAIAFQSRLRAAITASGIDSGLPSRRLAILRDNPTPSGRVTQDLVARAVAAGAVFISPTEADKRAFLALIALADSQAEGFEAWLKARKPLFETSLFQSSGLAPPAFLTGGPPPPGPAREPESPPPEPQTIVDPPPRAPEPRGAEDIVIGRRLERGAPGAPVRLPADALPRHVAVLAGTGSGKTVLLRRIIEEAALAGIPSIVLDSNNDLARLGLPWPSPPTAFEPNDAEKANAYFRKADVVVWTPGAPAGNPLSLNLLPDFAALGGGPQGEAAREQAIQMALATLGEILPASGKRAKLMEGVLADALWLFAREGGSLGDLIGLLGEFDPDASKINGAPKLASEIADLLNAAVSTNPLLKASAPPLDLARLFTGPNGKPRISVMNLSGLAGDRAKQDFVNRLQMSLFAWIQRHPSPTGRLYALDEAQNFAPSATSTACKASALALVAQARKYGLGMLFATQQPKAIDHKIVSNCATHFYGRMASPAAIEAIEEMLAAKGGGGENVARLTAGEFLFSTDGGARPIKIRAAMCLSWHPANPPTAEEVVEIARRSQPDVARA